MNRPVVLCVDDEKDILDNLLAQLMAVFGNQYDIELAATGREALQIFRDSQAAGIEIPLVIVDYIMPGMKGDELLVALHRLAPAMMKIMLTGQATVEGITTAFQQANLYRYIAKPWEEQDLIQTVQTALKSYAADKSLLRLIEEKNALLKSVRAAEEKYRHIFENVNIGIFHTDNNGRITVANPAMARILGYDSAADLLAAGKTLTQLYSGPGERDAFFSLLQQKKAGGQVEATFITRLDERIVTEIHIQPIYAATGELIRLEGSFIDITEKTKSREMAENITFALIESLENVNQLNDLDTGRHNRRVSKYAELIARESGCEPEFISKIKLYASLHDVGKVGLPDLILNKPDSYTREEMKIMQNHVSKGIQILSHPGIDQMAKNIVQFHHERWDGTGYLEGLKGAAIPLEARIVALADVFDALVNRRIYKTPFTIDAAFNLIAGESGRHFDPRLAGVFLQNKKKIIQIKHELLE